jgi:hypothetical protein
VVGWSASDEESVRDAEIAIGDLVLVKSVKHMWPAKVLSKNDGKVQFPKYDKKY